MTTTDIDIGFQLAVWRYAILGDVLDTPTLKVRATYD